jgi:hypothetical protein
VSDGHDGQYGQSKPKEFIVKILSLIFLAASHTMITLRLFDYTGDKPVKTFPYKLR